MNFRTQLRDGIFVIYGLWQVIGALCLIDSLFLPLYAAGMATLVGLGLWDYFSISKDKSQFSIDVRMPKSIYLGEKATIELLFYGPAIRPSWLAKSSEVLCFTGEEVVRLDEVDENVFALEYSVLSRSIGYEVWPEFEIQLGSRFGWWTRSIKLQVENCEIRVHPELSKPSPEKLQEYASHHVLQGEKWLNRGATPDQFHSIRKYAYPDPLKYIDAKKSSRYQKLMVRNYEQWQSHHLIIGLDCGRNMMGTVRGMRKVDFYVSAALALSQEALAAGDQVSFFSMSDQPGFLLKGVKSAEALAPVYRGMIQPKENSTQVEMLPPTISRFSNQRAIFVYLTDWIKPSNQEALLRVARTISRKHLFAIVGLDDESYFVNDYLDQFQDNRNTGESAGELVYRYWLNDQKKTFTSRVAQAGAVTVHAPDKYWLKVVSMTYQRLRNSLASG